jgi:hypothetical protein
MVFLSHMIYSPERKTQCQNQFSNHNYINLVQKTAHSVRANPPSSRPTCLVLLVLAQIVPALTEH